VRLVLAHARTYFFSEVQETQHEEADILARLMRNPQARSGGDMFVLRD